MPTFNYQVIRSQRKTTKLQIKNGELIIKTNNQITSKEIDQLLVKHQSWIEKHLKHQDPEVVYLFGQPYYKQLTTSKTNSYLLVEDKIMMMLKSADQQPVVIKKLYEDQRLYLESLIQACVAQFPKPPKSVTLKHLSRTLGICHRDGSISIGWQVARYPSAFIKMVIFHELCHLVHMNHSPAFYNLLSEYVPNYKVLKQVTKHIS